MQAYIYIVEWSFSYYFFFLLPVFVSNQTRILSQKFTITSRFPQSLGTEPKKYYWWNLKSNGYFLPKLPDFAYGIPPKDSKCLPGSEVMEWNHPTTTTWKIFKSDFLRVPRIGRHSRKINFSFISPKHSYGWTCSRKNSSKFQRFLLRPKFKKVWNLHLMAVFAAWNVQNFTLLYENSGGEKTILWKQNFF